MDEATSNFYDEDVEAQCEMGHSESKGAKKRDKSNRPLRGVATSFGFRRRPASSSRADNARRGVGAGAGAARDNNGNGGSSEDLRPEEVLSGRSTPLARPRKETATQPLRSNRFGFRHAHGKARVGDVSHAHAAELAFAATPKDKDTHFNNNASDKRGPNSVSNQLGLVPTQVTANGSTTVVGAAGLPKTVTKQTVILTYHTQQYAVQQDTRTKSGAAVRGSSASRAEVQRPPGKYTFQTNQLPRPQYPHVKTIDAKANKQVVNTSRKAIGANGWREGAGSAVSTDSGVCTGEGEAGVEAAGEGEGSPRSRRRPRNLEMVMRGAHAFQLRDLQDTDLDIMDEAVVTGSSVIPLPKLPSTFDGQPSPDYPTPTPTYRAPSPILPKPTPVQFRQSPMSTLERYRTRTRPSRIQNLDYKDEEKFVLDRAQPELLNKQNSFTKPSSGVESPATVSSSKESSPSCKSEESHFTSSAWQNHAAGEAMANRSQDDVSLALNVSSCEDERSKLEGRETKAPEMPKKTIVIMDEPSVPHPLLMKSVTLNQHDSFRGSMMGSMTSSNYSTTSTATNQSGDHHLTLTLEESKFDMSVLETSTHSLLDDETSPADSLISSTSTSGSNNDLHVEREPTISSSAYQTANTKSRSPEPEDGVDEEALQPVKEVNESPASAEASKNVSPDTPGTPTHASGELSLSDGKDYFDDEIADQPALLFRKNNDGSKTLDSDTGKHLRRSRERIPVSPLVQRNRKLCRGGTERTASLDTLSSLASDDLMMDNDLAKSITSLQSVDDYIERLDSSLRSGLNSLDERQLRQELASSKTCVRQWSQLLEQSHLLDQQLAAIGTGESLSTSTHSLTNIGASLPVRTARLLQRSRTGTPFDTGASDGSASPAPAPATPPAPAPANLLQDVVDIKTLLLQLKRVLQEPGEEHHSMSSETLDPLLAACAESPARVNGRRLPGTAAPAPSAALAPLHPDACAEMRRQIIYLQGQLEERDRLVRVLQSQMLRLSEQGPPAPAHAHADDTCNRATQTDRLRLPTSIALTSSENSGLVSWNEQVSGRRLPLYSEAQKTRRPVNGTITKICQCGGRKVSIEDDRKEPNVTRTTSLVGSKYLQAVAKNTDTRRYIKRDSSVGEKSERKLMYSARSRSIENFQNQPYAITEPLLAKNAVIEETNTGLQRHHTSYGDLYNGRISSKESVNGNRHSPSLNGQSTDTDYSSDGGYKSLPSSINCNGYSPKKVSGIPRRSVEQRFLSTKHVKASAV